MFSSLFCKLLMRSMRARLDAKNGSTLSEGDKVDQVQAAG
jgi:hypothetical protein